MQLTLRDLAKAFVSDVIDNSAEEKEKYGFLEKLESQYVDDFTIIDKKEYLSNGKTHTLYYAKTNYGSGIVFLVVDQKIQGYLYFETAATFINDKFLEFDSVEVSTIYIPKWNRNTNYILGIIRYFQNQVISLLNVDAIVISVSKDHDKLSSLVKHYLKFKFYIAHICGKDNEYINVPKKYSMDKNNCKSYAITKGIPDIECYLMAKKL